MKGNPGSNFIITDSSRLKKLHIKSFARGMFMNCAELKPDGRYEELGHKQTVKIHPSSVLFGSKPHFVIFNELGKFKMIINIIFLLYRIFS